MRSWIILAGVLCLAGCGQRGPTGPSGTTSYEVTRVYSMNLYASLSRPNIYKHKMKWVRPHALIYDSTAPAYPSLNGSAIVKASGPSAFLAYKAYLNGFYSLQPGDLLSGLDTAGDTLYLRDTIITMSRARAYDTLFNSTHVIVQIDSNWDTAFDTTSQNLYRSHTYSSSNTIWLPVSLYYSDSAAAFLMTPSLEASIYEIYTPK